MEVVVFLKKKTRWICRQIPNTTSSQQNHRCGLEYKSSEAPFRHCLTSHASNQNLHYTRAITPKRVTSDSGARQFDADYLTRPTWREDGLTRSMWGWGKAWIAVRIRELESLENGEDWKSGNQFSILPLPSHISRQIVRVKFSCSRVAGRSPRLSGWATQLRRNVAVVANRWRYCVRFDQPGKRTPDLLHQERCA